jgi:hypothetical protein
MKVLTTLGLTLASSTAFGGLVYLVTPLLEEFCDERACQPGSAWQSGSRLLGGYIRSMGGGHLDLLEDGTYMLTRSGDQPESERETGAWTVDGTRVHLRSEAGDVRTLQLQIDGGLLLLETDESFVSVESLTDLCGY